MIFKELFLLVANFCIILHQTNAIENLYTPNSYAASAEALKQLLELEERLSKNLEEYLYELKHKLNLAERALNNFKAEQLKRISDSEFFDNPLNSFALLRHQCDDWSKWAAYMEQLPGTAQIAFANEMRTELPTAWNLEEASESLERLVDNYDLNQKELAAGQLLQYSQPSSALTSVDCNALGMFNLFQKNYLKSETWLNISLSLYDVTKQNIYDAMGFNKSNLLMWLGYLLIKRRQNAAGLQHLQQSTSLQKNAIAERLELKAIYQKLCSEGSQPQNQLQCRYNNWTTPFLRIAPLKMEELNMDPIVVIYHDVIYESEIESLLNRTNDFKHALLDGYVLSDYRTAQNANPSRDASAVTRTITKRLADMSGLILKGSTYFSLVNYGIGGHFNVHIDAHQQDHPEMGNRIATVLFYLGHIESGGATVFPHLNLSVQPKRGTALLFYNLQDDGTEHPKSLHGACPVIVGTKYLLIQWIYSMEQMFIKPCLAKTH